jgi:hypothetical protein
MEDREANEGPADESTCPTQGEDSTVEEIEMYIVTTADNSDETVIGTEGNTDPHKSLLSVFQEINTHSFSYTDIRESMPQQQTNAEVCSEIVRAIDQRDKARVESMLQHPSAHLLHLDYYPEDKESTVKEIIMQTYPELKPLLPAPVMEILGSSERDIKLLAALHGNEYDIFSETLDSDNSNPWYDEPYHSYLLEIACQMNRIEFVKLLLEKGADPNIENRDTKMPLLHTTARSGNLELLEMLLNKDEIDVDVTDKK